MSAGFSYEQFGKGALARPHRYRGLPGQPTPLFAKEHAAPMIVDLILVSSIVPSA
ncbi:hypothetical protein CC1G_13057 [Coprinopsis cinerea okayama7|uniref:Uncharacterized protein n=1 Tax=Coprinopsis cinerea (strain Okayama-7 / 130 / ATCC MYA-4618 / FGSC 9003) TaxID=240176 RepID=A8PFA7_COPC7|nr:hypothetical protein CC1G_13057 [Coprinopsis cinerea okayama7\|eukprot:XP_001840965.2 hypothetical protein CC1G_13057 [Coprinopsis cinerea okayama7\